MIDKSSIEVLNGNFAKPVLSAVAVKLSKAKIRAIVFDKCGGKCAYLIFIIIFALWEQKQTLTF